MANKIKELTALLNTVPSGQLTEEAIQTYLNILNIEIVEKGSATKTKKYIDSLRDSIKADNEKMENTESPKAKAVRLISEALCDINNNPSKYGYTSGVTRVKLEYANTYIARKEYKRAFEEVNDSSVLQKNFKKFSELMAALSELI